MKFVIHLKVGDKFSYFKAEGDTPQATLEKYLANPTRDGTFVPVAWSEDCSVNGSYQKPRIEALQVGRLIVDGKAIMPGQVATPQAKPDQAEAARLTAQNVANTAMLQRDKAALAKRTPRPNVPAPVATKPQPRVFPAMGFTSPDMVRSTHLVNPLHGSAALI